MKKVYTTPTLKVVEFKAENGFATSGFSARIQDDQINFEMMFDENEGPRNEQYGFFGGDGFWD